MKKTYQNIIWDWNGTIVNDMWLCVDIVNELLISKNKPTITADDYHKHFDFPVQEYYRKIGFDFTVDSFDELTDFFIGNYMKRLKECSLQENAESTLSLFHEKGLNQYVLSAASQNGLDTMSKHFKIQHFFKAIAGRADEYAVSKVEHGLSLIKNQNIDPQTTIMIGDTSHDFEVANELGIDCLLVTIGHHPEDRLRKNNGQVNVVKDIQSAVDFILS